MPNSLSFCPRRGLKQRQEPEQHESANSQVAGQTGRRWIYGAGINSAPTLDIERATGLRSVARFPF